MNAIFAQVVAFGPGGQIQPSSRFPVSESVYPYPRLGYGLSFGIEHSSRDGAGRLYPLGEGDGNVRNAHVYIGPHCPEPDEDGNYSVRASRKLHPIQTINTNYVEVPKEVDLRGDLGDEYRFDVILERR